MESLEDFDTYYDEIDEELIQAYLNGEELDPELEAYLSQYQKEYGQEYEEITSYSLSELGESCMLPVLTGALKVLLPLLALSFIFKLVSNLWKPGSDEVGIPRSFLHLTSALFGVLALHLVFSRDMLYILYCCCLVYIVFFVVHLLCRQYCGIAVSTFIIIYIISCELYLVEETAWHKVRGAQIILSMKVIGLAFDVSNGAELMPSMSEYLGYVLCVGTVIFGPWVSYQDYKNMLNQDYKSMNIWWIIRVVNSAAFSLICMIYSTCLLTNWLIPNSSYKWILAYRDAQSFRFSHYFVSFASETTALLCGLKGSFYKDNESSWSVSKPQHIEVPRSLVEVVTYWNLPMHYWLKTSLQIGPLKLSKCLAVSASAFLSRGTIAVTCHHESSPRIFKAASPRPIVIMVIRHVTMIRGDRFIADLQSGRSSADRGSTVPECHGVSVTLAKIT